MGALDDLAEDRATVAVALARIGRQAEARELIGQVETFFAGLRRMAGAADRVTRFQFAKLALARGLIASEAAEKWAAFVAGLAQIAARPPQPQQMRSTKVFKAELERELTAVK